MKLNYLTLGFIILLGLTSCNKDNDSTPEPVTKANIIGSVNLYNEGVTQIDNSNMIIRVEGTELSAITDTEGDFTLSDVPFGTYTLIYEKSGFGTFKNYNIEHTNTGSSTIISETPSLGEISTTQITAIESSVIGNNIHVSITTNPAGSNNNTRYIRFFLSENSNVSNEKYAFYSSGFVSQINPYVIILSKDDLISAGFSSDQTVYLKAYGDSYWSNKYDDPALGRKVFPNLNMTSANSVSLIVP